MSSPRLRHAVAGDIPVMEALLASQHLPVYAIAEYLDTFWVLEEQGQLIGCTGLELYGQSALLRSVIIQESHRNQRLGERLVRNALEEARRRGVRTVYLFTMHAAGYFARFGFQRCSLDDFRDEVRQSFQYRGVSSIPELTEKITPMCLELESEPEQASL
ncbi:MAG TPA: GNAT family N-acetyltransferase, partial [Dehalococcoidia bacterium]|nr:GNAT family N-acetyltransferase [Dehalococcoidia bacterium]